EGDLDDLGVVGRAGAHLAVGGIVGRAALIARDGVGDARHLGEEMLDTPEASRSERGFFHGLGLRDATGRDYRGRRRPGHAPRCSIVAPFGSVRPDSSGGAGWHRVTSW